MSNVAVSEPFARLLRASRDDLNARFAEARQRLPQLAGDAFSDFLVNSVDPLLRAVDAATPDRVDAVALAAYDIALELVGQRLAGSRARDNAIGATWARVLPASARLVAAEPSRVLASLSNAAHQVAGTPGAKPGTWLDDMRRLAASCATVDELLRVGQVAAWRAGLAHFRRGAIAAAASLPEPLALDAVRALPDARWSDVEAGLLASEWFDPAKSRGAAPDVKTVGAFRGFGGVFAEPPRVTFAGDHLHVLSGDECWLLTADLYGATFHRVAPNEAQLPPPSTSVAPGMRLPQGRGAITSVATSPTTVAVTWSLTHHVMLVGRG